MKELAKSKDELRSPIRNQWYNAYLLTCIFYIVYPLLVQGIAKEQWLDWHVFGSLFAVGSIVCLFFAASAVPSGGVEVLLLALYYLPLLLCVLSGVLAMHGRKGWRFVAYTVLSVDVICNFFILPERIVGLVVDAALIIFLMLAVKRGKGDCSI